MRILCKHKHDLAFKHTRIVCLSVASSCQNLIILTTCIHRFSQNLLHIFVILWSTNFISKLFYTSFLFTMKPQKPGNMIPSWLLQDRKLKAICSLTRIPHIVFFFLIISLWKEACFFRRTFYKSLSPRNLL